MAVMPVCCAATLRQSCHPGVAPHGGLATAEELDAAHAAESRPAPQTPEDYWSPQQVNILPTGGLISTLWVSMDLRTCACVYPRLAGCSIAAFLICPRQTRARPLWSSTGRFSRCRSTMAQSASSGMTRYGAMRITSRFMRCL
jgi:hypothetical protein